MAFPTTETDLRALLDTMKAKGASKNQMKAVIDQYSTNQKKSSESFLGRATQEVSQAPVTPNTQAKVSEVQSQIGTDTGVGQDPTPKTKISEVLKGEKNVWGETIPDQVGIGPFKVSTKPGDALKGTTTGMLVDTLKTGASGLKNLAQGGYEMAKEGAGASMELSGKLNPLLSEEKSQAMIEKGKEMQGETSGEGFRQSIDALMQTVFSPVAGVLQNVPGGEKVMELASKPREWFGDLVTMVADKAGVDTATPGFEEAKNQMMSAFDVGTVFLPQTKTGKGIINKTSNLAKDFVVKTADFTTRPVRYFSKEGLVKFSGLNSDTLKAIVENPSKYKTVKDVGVDLSKQNLFENVKTAIDDTKQALSDTGAGYNSIRAQTTPARIPDGYWEALSSDLKIKPQVDSAGNLMGFVADSKSLLRSSSDLKSLADSLAPYWGKTELLPEEFLNYRTDLSNLAKFDSAKTTQLTSTAENLRIKANESIGSQIEGLRQLDAEYSPQREYVKKLEELIYDKKGNIKDNALSTIANITGKGKEMKLARLEEIMPEVASDVKAIKALENVKLAPNNMVGQYSRSGATVYAFGKAIVGDPSAIPYAIGLALTHPAIVSEFVRVFGEAKIKLSKATVENIATKIDNGDVLTASESASVAELLGKIETSDLVPFLAIDSGSEPVDDSSRQ